MISPRSCVAPTGSFIVGIHRPEFSVKNFRENEYITTLGELEDQGIVDNTVNFPNDDLHEPSGDIIYEIANAFPFRGTTYINSVWANKKAAHPENISIPEPHECSLFQSMDKWCAQKGTSFDDRQEFLSFLPIPVCLGLAGSSTDPEELVSLARLSCRLIFDKESGLPVGMGYKRHNNIIAADINDHELFEVLVNNPFLPDVYKEVMVLRPGVQGSNEITGEFISDDGKTHIFEYLRRNSYIPWGHFASNMANDAIRYRAKELSFDDMTGIRHLYYQRIYSRLACQLDIKLPVEQKCLSSVDLEMLRKDILSQLVNKPRPSLDFNAALWGWNFGFGFAQSGYRLHASHQMIHQQNAMIPVSAIDSKGRPVPSFSCGDLIDNFVRQYRKVHNKNFFKNYVTAIKNNLRTDGNGSGVSDLIVFEDSNIILFVPKAQISQWELQMIPKRSCGNVLEADDKMRRSMDKGILLAIKILESMGGKMITSIEFSKRFDSDNKDHFLLYSFIPRLPEAPDTFSEAQLRWISGCFPEDFAFTCRNTLKQL
jgi:hypothetical protein